MIHQANFIYNSDVQIMTGRIVSSEHRKQNQMTCYSNKKLKKDDALEMNVLEHKTKTIYRWHIVELLEEKKGNCGFKYHYKFSTQETIKALKQ